MKARHFSRARLAQKRDFHIKKGFFPQENHFAKKRIPLFSAGLRIKSGGLDMEAVLLVSWVVLVVAAYKIAVVVLEKAGKL
jgi:hypothetical protein